jgi:hypothetical protein
MCQCNACALWQPKTARCQWPWPKPYWRGKPTKALELLRRCVDPKGVPHEYFHPGRGWATTAALQAPLIKLSRAGWIETRQSGPRGGVRWHITELGLRVLTVANNYQPGSAMDTAFILIKP